MSQTAPFAILLSRTNINIIWIHSVNLITLSLSQETAKGPRVSYAVVQESLKKAVMLVYFWTCGGWVMILHKYCA